MEKRSESTMMDIILEVARQQTMVRAVVLQGSRANPRLTGDDWQDYDVVYLVEILEPLIADHEWINQFGERVILQMPESMQLPPPANDGTFAYLMLFTDGNRIDLTLVPMAVWQKKKIDSLSLLLLDKDDRFTNFPLPDESDYYLQRPTEKKFLDCCNEFWWTTTYVAKGLGRKEVVYAKTIQETIVRPMLDQMIRWHIGTVHGLAVNPGKNGKHFKRYMSERHWQSLMDTYSGASIPQIWKSLLAMTDLFENLAGVTAAYFEFTYPTTEAQNVKNYLLQQFQSSIDNV